MVGAALVGVSYPNLFRQFLIFGWNWKKVRVGRKKASNPEMTRCKSVEIRKADFENSQKLFPYIVYIFEPVFICDDCFKGLLTCICILFRRMVIIKSNTDVSDLIVPIQSSVLIIYQFKAQFKSIIISKLSYKIFSEKYFIKISNKSDFSSILTSNVYITFV